MTFAQFDAEGDGTVDAEENMLEALKNSSGANLQGELSQIIRQLQACSLIPGEALIWGLTAEEWALLWYGLSIRQAYGHREIVMIFQ